MTKRTREQLAQAADDAMRELNELDTGAVAPSPVRARGRAKDPSQVYSVRIPVERIEQLRQLAEARQETPSGLLRRWVLERLALEVEGRGAEGPSSDLELLIDGAVARALARRGLLEGPVVGLRSGVPEPEYLDPSGPVRIGARRLRGRGETREQAVQ